MTFSNYLTIFSNSVPLMIATMYQTFIQGINIHYATNKQMMAGIGMATIIIHCIGGSLIHGINIGYSSLASRAFGAKNIQLYKKNFFQGFVSLIITLLFFGILTFFSHELILMTGQTPQIALYAYKTLLYHLPGIACFYISDFFWSYLNSQKIFKPVNYVFFIGLILHILLSITVSKTYGFYGIVVSTNIMFLSIFSMTLYLACTKVQWNIIIESFKIQNPFSQYWEFIKQCLYVAVPHALGMFMFEFMSLYVGSFKFNDQTAAHVAVANFQSCSIAPHFGYSIYALTVIGQYTGQNNPQKVKQIIKSTVIISMVTLYIILIVSVIFRSNVASFYLHDINTHKYFFIMLNYFLLRGFISVIKLNFEFILRAIGFGNLLIVMNLVCYSLVGIVSIIVYCHYLQNKVLAVWLGFTTSQIVLDSLLLYTYFKTNIQEKTQELYNKIKSEKQNENTFY